ncbi:MAG: hypothetical protein PHT88_01315 [Candidatus Moranbacteria bacterium]|nr:hypothetical protein [Candidatus Moranbacteria bacterium]
MVSAVAIVAMAEYRIIMAEAVAGSGAARVFGFIAGSGGDVAEVLMLSCFGQRSV